MRKAVFLDRDGVINQELGHYVYRIQEFEIIPGVKEALLSLRSMGYLIIVVTNQAGISKGIYDRMVLELLHRHMQERLDYLLDAIYYSPYHPTVSNSLSRKPGTLMFERARAKYNLSMRNSWMVGDRERDMIPARDLGISSVAVGVGREDFESDFKAADLSEASRIIGGSS